MATVYGQNGLDVFNFLHSKDYDEPACSFCVRAFVRSGPPDSHEIEALSARLIIFISFLCLEPTAQKLYSLGPTGRLPLFLLIEMRGYVTSWSKVGEVLQIFCRLAEVVDCGSDFDVDDPNV